MRKLRSFWGTSGFPGEGSSIIGMVIEGRVSDSNLALKSSTESLLAAGTGDGLVRVDLRVGVESALEGKSIHGRGDG